MILFPSGFTLVVADSIYIVSENDCSVPGETLNRVHASACRTEEQPLFLQ